MLFFKPVQHFYIQLAINGLMGFHIFLVESKTVHELGEIFLESGGQNSNVDRDGSYLVTFFNGILPLKDAKFLEGIVMLHLLIFMGQAQCLGHSQCFLNE